MHSGPRRPEKQLPVLASAAAPKVWSYWVLPPRVRLTATCGRGGGRTIWDSVSRRRQRHGYTELGSFPHLPSPSPPPLTCGSRGARGVRRGGGQLWVRVPGVWAPSPGRRGRARVGRTRRRRGRVSGCGPGSVRSSQPRTWPLNLTRPPRTVCREGPGSALRSSSARLAPLGRGSRPLCLSSLRLQLPFLTPHGENLPSVFPFPSLLPLRVLSLVQASSGFCSALLGQWERFPHLL